MHLHLEQTSHVRSDSSIQSLSWMGRVPEEQPEGDGWKLNRASYYQEGWLATGNTRGVVGVTYTSTVAPNKTVPPPRTNFNLRGHRTPICLVRWNEPYQKLATCDTSGVIFVWIRYEGRWSIELINDRNTPVTHFAWSHDGRMALISYQDGFVLVGSVAGQRYWSTMLSIDSTMSCGAWTPDDQHVYVGTSNGTLLVLDVYGTMVAQLKIAPDVALTALQWNCPRFKMEENATTTCAAATAQSGTPVTSITSGSAGPSVHRPWVLAVLQASGQLSLMKAHDDVSPVHVDTGLKAACIDWSNAGDYLCVAGHVMCNNQVHNWLKFYTEAGHLRYSFPLSATQVPITSITWGHNDRRLFVATGSLLHVAWVTRKVPTLQHLARLEIKAALPAQYALENLLLPKSIRHIVDSLFLCTLQSYIPDKNLRDFVCRPPQGNTRLYCTMIRKDEETSASAAYSNHGEQISLDTGYVLYLETLGSLQPLLKGKPTSKLRPDFVIFDPQSDSKDAAQNGTQASNGSSLPASPWLSRRSIRTPVISRRRANAFPGNTVADEAAASDSEPDDSCIASPRLQRRWKRRHAPLTATTTNPAVASFSTRRELDDSSSTTTSSQQDSAYDPLPEYEKLAQVTSNIWGTKFKIHGLSSQLPAFLGQVTYKTSLLHLQPRQMTLLIVDLRDPPASVLPSSAAAPDKAFDPYQFSEDEEEIKELPESVPPIAPMTPRLRVRQRRQATRAAKPSPDLLEPPPAPTHRPSVKHVSRNGLATAGGPDLLEDVLRVDVDTNEQFYLSTDRVVFAAKRRVRSLSVGHIDKMNRTIFYSAVPAPNSRSSLNRVPTRKCRSLDSSPQTSAKLLPTIMSWSKENPNTDALYAKNLRASFRSTLTSSKDSESPSTSTSSSTSSTTSSSETSVKMSSMKAHSCMTGLARLSPLLGRKWERWQGRNQAEALAKRNGVSAPTTPNASPLVPRRRPKRERHASPIRQLFNSPLLSRKVRKERQPIESSDSEDEATPKTDYRDLESFQKAQLLQKFKQSLTPEVGTPTVRRKQFILNNKAPLWNEHSQVYQLDFGGRVTQESAKNFQIEYRGKQVMQFGRIDGNAYTLDFQYPFSAVQAFAVALANVTQRLK